LINEQYEFHYSLLLARRSFAEASHIIDVWPVSTVTERDGGM
jgi:hypothetical protein